MSMIKFINYMVKYIINYRESMFEFEKFKDYISSRNHVIVLTGYEKKIRDYIRVFYSQ